MNTKHRTHEPCKEPPSELEDLVRKTSKLKGIISGKLKEVDKLCYRFMEATPSTAEDRDPVERVWKIVADMERRYQEIDAHYGWVMASDRELRDKVLRSHFGMGIDGKVWLKRSIKRLRNTRRILDMSQQRIF